MAARKKAAKTTNKTKATKKQELIDISEEALEAHCKEWEKVAFSCAPVDVERAKKGLETLYKVESKLPLPEVIVVPSPQAAYKLIRERLNDKDFRSSPPFWGQSESYWISFYRIFEQHGLKYSKEDSKLLAAYEDVARSCSWVWPFNDFCVICDRPESISLDERLFLNNRTGPALSFRDGFKIYAIGGIVLDEKIVMAPGELTLAEIDGEANVEVRRIMVEQLGPERYAQKMAESGLVEVIHDDFGKLYKRKTAAEGDQLFNHSVVEVINATPEPDGHYKHYFLRVPDSLPTPMAAVAWTFGCDAGDYHPLLET